MSDDMFRYLLKYVGKYRVLTELTTDTNDFVRDENGNIHSDYDELYIPCSYDGKIKHTYTPGKLAYFTEKTSVIKKIKNQFKELKVNYEIDEVGKDFIVYFNDSDLTKVAKLLGVKTTGKKIHPFNKKNIPDAIKIGKPKTIAQVSISYKIPTEDMKLYYDAMSPIKDRKTKMASKKEFIAKFIESLKDDEFESKRNKMQMGEMEYIHYSGQWQKFISYIKEHIKN